jgi:hypothetical protein
LTPAAHVVDLELLAREDVVGDLDQVRLSQAGGLRRLGHLDRTLMGHHRVDEGTIKRGCARRR